MPIAKRGDDDAGRHILGDFRLAVEDAAIVEDADQRAFADLAARGIARIDEDRLLALDRDPFWLVGVLRIQEAVALRRDDVERIALRLTRIRLRPLESGDISRQRIERLAALLAFIHLPERRRDEIADFFRRLRPEFAFARRRREIAFRMRRARRRIADVEAIVAMRAEIFHVDAAELRALPV